MKTAFKRSHDDTRERWLVQAVDILRAEVFAPVGYAVPSLRVSCGWPAKKPGIELTAHQGQCWHPDAAADHQPQVFISPIIADAVPVLDTLAHELVHASGQWDHRKGFRTVAVAIGLQGPMRSTVAGPALQARLAAIADRLGRYPAQRADAGHAAPRLAPAALSLPVRPTREGPVRGRRPRRTLPALPGTLRAGRSRENVNPPLLTMNS